MNEKYQKLKEAIQAANPEKHTCSHCGIIKGTLPSCAYKIHKNPDTLRLADVLLAIESTKKWPPYRIGTHGLFFVAKEVSATPGYISTGITWNLKDDNLDHQSEETKQFLIDLLTQ